MISTPEIDRLTRERDEHRKIANTIEDRLRLLRSDERSRRKLLKKHKTWTDPREVRAEMHRLRVLLCAAMKRQGASQAEIREAVGANLSNVRSMRQRLLRIEEHI